ncbi:hypothetical protein GCM10027258_82830 [Amycolatopsis stemonae]
MRKWGKYAAAAVAAMVTAVVMTGPQAAAAEGCRWSSSALPVPDGYRLGSVGQGDGAGAITGTLRPNSLDGPILGVVWRADEPHVLGAAFGLDTELADVNTSGVAVGSYTDPRVFGEFPLDHAIRYADGRFERLPAPPGYPNTKALAINARGDIMGQVGETAATGVGTTVVWPADAPGTVRVLPMPLPGWQVAAGIDDDGTVAAAAFDQSTGGYLAGYVLPSGGGSIRMASPVSSGSVTPSAITAQRITGDVEEAGAFLWRLDGSIDRALPGLRSVSAMNAAGAIVGRADDGSTLFLPAGGGPEQTVVPSGQDAQVKEVAENGDVFGVLTTQSPEYRQDLVRWHCG